MRDKRILQLIGDLNPGGAETVVVTLSKELKNLKYDVAICSREGGALVDRLNGIPTYFIKKTKVIDINYLALLCQCIYKHDIELIHSHLFGNNLYAFFAGILTGRKIILTVHGEDSIKNRKRLIFYKYASHFVSKIITVSNSLYETFVGDVGIKRSKVALIKNGIRVYARDKNKINIDQKKTSLGLPLGVPILGSVGNIKHVKGYDVLINAAEYIRNTTPDACFVIVGEAYQPEYKKYLENLINDKKLVNKFHFLGKRTDVEEILPVIDVFILPSRTEGTSISLLEAMAAFRPIIATKVGGTPEIVEHGNTGILVPSENPVALAEAINMVLKDEKMLHEYGKRARDFVEKEYDIGVMIDKYVALYNEVFGV